MAHSVHIPFLAFKIRLSEDNFIAVPGMDTQSVRINEPIHLLAGRYAEKFQKKVLNKGDFQKVLSEYIGNDFKKSTINVGFNGAKDKISYPTFELTFEYYYLERKNGFLGIIPTLGIDGFGQDIALLERNLVEVIHLDFARNKRLDWVRNIVPTIWERSIDIAQEEILLTFPTLKELEDLQAGGNEEWLPKVAKEIKISRKIVYEREQELDQLTKILRGKFSRNALLVGQSGVGKTALIWEVIHQKEQRKIKGEFWETTASTLIKELTGETGWQDNLPKVCQEITKRGAILYVNNLMELFEVGKYEGNDTSIAEYLLPYINRGEITLISECSEEELARIELNNPNYLTFFQIIRLEEPKKNLEEIIINKVNDLAARRNVRVKKEAIQETLRLNRRYTPYSGLPGKPIRFLEGVLINSKNLKQDTIDRSFIIQSFCEETGMPIFMVDPSLPMDVEKTKERFNQTVFGQKKAVDSLVNVLSSVKAALTYIGKPIASFLFVGPTGVGKTELAKTLAEFVFGNRDRVIRFDMSEFADPYAVSRLAGSDFYADGLLTSAVHQTPFCVLLFDEIEKAHPNFYDLLLQLLSEGRLTNSKGKLVNFCSTIIIMTSNIGASNLQGNRISLQKQMGVEDVKAHFMGAVQQFFKPELFNRIDEVIPFAPLSSMTIRYVVDREMQLFKQLEGISHRKLTLNLTDDVLNYLAIQGFDPKYGARRLQRAIRQYLIIPLSKELNLYDDKDHLIIQIFVEKEQLKISVEVVFDTDLMMEELEKCSQADIISDLRRNIYRIKESNLYVKLLNELRMMERMKNKKSDLFWANQQRGEQYTHFLQIEQKFKLLCQQIELLEQDASLAYMNIINYTTELEEREKKWQADFQGFKMELCYHLQPSYNECWVGIFGKAFMEQFQLYQKFLQEKQLDFAVKTIWYREAFYNAFSQSETTTGNTKNRYIEVSFPTSQSLQFKPPEKGDLPVGIMLKVMSPCIYLWLKEEGGLHIWKKNDKKGVAVIVQVNTEDFCPPNEIHRKLSLKEMPTRRTYEKERMIDKHSKQTYDIHKSNYLTHLMPYLENQFERNLEEELL